MKKPILAYKKSTRTAFSLIELLVALSILAVVSAIIVPKYVGMRTQAMLTAAQASVRELNNIYNHWQSLGGYLKVDPTTIASSWALSYLSSGTGRSSSGFGDSTGPMGSSLISIPAQNIATSGTTVPLGLGFNNTGSAVNGIQAYTAIYNFGGKYYRIDFDGTRPDPFYLYPPNGTPTLYP